jgi:hypothetical protein
MRGGPVTVLEIIKGWWGLGWGGSFRRGDDISDFPALTSVLTKATRTRDSIMIQIKKPTGEEASAHFYKEKVSSEHGEGVFERLAKALESSVGKTIQEAGSTVIR